MKNLRTLMSAIAIVVILLLLNNIIPHTNNIEYYIAFTFLVISFILCFFAVEKIMKSTNFSIWLPSIFIIGLYILTTISFTIFSNKLSLKIILSLEIIALLLMVLFFNINYSHYKKQLSTKKKYSKIDDRFTPKRGDF